MVSKLYLLTPNLELVDEVSWSNLPADSGYARSPNGTGNFVVKWQTFYLNNDWAVGVEDVIDESQVVVYPNPANDYVIVKLSENAAQHIEEVELLDITGKFISKTNTARTVRISTANLADGMYLLRLGNVSKKLMIQH